MLCVCLLLQDLVQSCWIGGVGCNPRVTFDGKVRNLGPLTFCLCVSPQIDFPLPEDHLSVSLSLPVGNIPD